MFPEILLLEIHPKGIVMVVRKAILCQRWRKDAQVCLCNQREAVLRAQSREAGLRPFPSPSPVQASDPMEVTWIASSAWALLLTQALHLPMQSPEEREGVAQVKAVWTGKASC